MNITKKQLAHNISNKSRISLEDSKNLVNIFFSIQSKILKTQNIKISRFGTFYKKVTPKRIGRNPKTMEEYLIPKRTRISFKSSNIAKKILN